MSALREVPLREISLELFAAHHGPTAIDVDDPLVVLEDSGHLILVDGFKRYFAQLAAKRETAWVLVKPWSRVQGRLERLLRNNPRRRTTLKEELEVLSALKLEEKLSSASVARALGRKTSWAERRYEILQKLHPEVYEILPERLFRPSVVHALALLEREEQVSTALALSSEALTLSEASGFLGLLEAADGLQRARLRTSPRAALEAARASAAQTSRTSPLHALCGVIDELLQKLQGEVPERARVVLEALRQKLDRTGAHIEKTSSSPAATVVAGEGDNTLFEGGIHHDHVGDRVLIQRLREAGLGARAISRKLGLSRNTVRDVLDPQRRKKRKKKKQAAEQPPAASEQLLDPFKGEIEALLLKDEQLKQENPSARPLSTRLVLKAIRKLGYTGGRTILGEHLRRLRGPKRRIAKAFRRFETDPALEAQQDWTTYRVKIAEKLVKVQIFSIILAWSRMQFLRAFIDQRLPTLLWGHVAAFHAFGGVPWRMVYDRQKAIVPIFIEGKPVLHDEFRAFKEHYGFEVFICQSGDKERKGKVEKPFRYVEEGFLPQREFQSLEDFNAQLEGWLDGREDPEEGNRREHGTTGEVPQERWLEEKKLLLPLPPTDRVVRHVEKRLVAKDCTISVLGCLYTVPPRLVEEGRREVWISIGPEDLLVHDDRGQLVATHRISRQQGKLVIDESHYKEIERRKRQVPKPVLEREILERFPSAAEFLKALEDTMRSLAPIHLRQILALARRYRREDVEAALKRALADGTATAAYVRKILERAEPSGLRASLWAELPRGLSLGVVDPGSSEAYKNIFEKEQPQDSKEVER